MRILAAVLIDGENISPTWAPDLHRVLDQETQRGVSLVARILAGNAQALGAWSGVIDFWHFQTRTHGGGKDAADWVLKEEALQLAQQGIARFYIVSNDGGFASLADLLRTRGCQVVGFGTLFAASRWQIACDLFLLLGEELERAAIELAALNQRARAVSISFGGSMGSSVDTIFVSHEQTQEALKSLYGSTSQPPMLTAILHLFLGHALTALCLSADDEPINTWSAHDDAQTLIEGTRDPLINFILEQDATLQKYWKAVQAFATRCDDAYEQGRTAAQSAFSHFPRHCFHTLHQENLVRLLSTWRYNPHAAPTEALPTYPGYRPEAEQAVLQRWFHRGYLAGSQEETTHEPTTRTIFKASRR